MMEPRQDNEDEITETNAVCAREKEEDGTADAVDNSFLTEVKNVGV